ncbi:hypothetical protein ACEWY4_005439 [Coilia grayii]|uniref:C-type lectin domain-containing protein n=1 Tax=Coilia grayii TaxID=363190 RepID=A0ABD1KIM7_9TELE
MSPLCFPLLVSIALAFGQASSKDSVKCKEGREEFHGSCYYLANASQTWAEAQQTCKSTGGNLVSIGSEEEDNFVKSLFNNTVVWIGGYRKQPDAMAWKWVSGENMEYSNWSSGQPRTFVDKNYIMMFKDGTWGNEVGTLPYPFVCEENPIPTCDDGYFLFRSYCYAFKEEKLAFVDAQKDCVANGGNLASVHSDKENKFLVKLTQKTYAWIGGRRDEENSEIWLWTDHTPFNYDGWAKKQPAANPANLCILMNYPDGVDSVGWSNELCDFAYSYVCEKPQLVAKSQ